MPKQNTTHYILFQAAVSRPNIIFAINEIETHQSNDVTLMLHTAGGKIIEALHFYNYIQSKKINLTTYNLSFVGSAGIELFLCGEKRICSPFSSFMLHESSWSFNKSLTVREMQEYIDGDKASHEIEQEFVRHRGGDLCAKTVEEWSKKDTTVPPKMALEIGLCTEISHVIIPDGSLVSKVQSPDFGES